MNKVEKLADTILYEGYLLYPYRKSALKNQHRFNFGLLAQKDFFQTQVLAFGDFAEFSVSVRFLQSQKRQVIDNQGNKFETLELENKIFESWEEALKRQINTQKTVEFHFKETTSEESFLDGKVKFLRQTNPIKGKIEVEKKLLRENLHLFSVKIFNLSQLDSFFSVHAVLNLAKGRFISLLEYEKEYENDVKTLQQKGLFPVLIERNIILSSPIILYDYPQIAPESDGDFYDLTEIDELLTLRVLTMTDDEKRYAENLDWRSAKILRQSAETSLMKLHGTFRQTEKSFESGKKVRLKPKKTADAFDIFLENQIAVIEKIEEDLEGKKYFSVILEKDLQLNFDFEKFIGHRFFFTEDELEIV